MHIFINISIIIIVFLAIIGKVASDNSLDYIDMIQLDKDFDLEFVNEIIPLSMHPNAKSFFERN